MILETINKMPKGMNLLPKISSTKKPLEENNYKKDESNNNINNNIKVNTKNNTKSSNNDNNNSNNSNIISELDSNNKITQNKEENTSKSNLNSSIVNINKTKKINNEINERINSPKKKTSGNIRAHKYHSIEKLNSVKNSNTTLDLNHVKPPIPDNNLQAETSSQHKSVQSYVSLSDASTAMALSSGHSTSISSLIKTDVTLNRQLPPPLPPNYPKNTGRSPESPRHLINLPKIIQPIVKIKENKNTSINLPSLIKNKTSKNSQRY